MLAAVTCIAGSPHVCSRIVPKSIDVAERQGLARLVAGLREAETLRLLQQKLFKQAVLGRVGFAIKHMRGDVPPSHLQTKLDVVPNASCFARRLSLHAAGAYPVHKVRPCCVQHAVVPKQLQAILKQSNVLLHALPSMLPQTRPDPNEGWRIRC